MRKFFIIQSVILALILSTFSMAASEDESSAVSIEKVAGNVYCLYGPGGNIAILKGSDGLLLVDSQIQPGDDKIRDNIKAFSPLPVKYLVNTHYHGDHTGGNEVIGKDAVFIMHPKCKASLLETLKKTNTEAEYVSGIKTWKKGMVLTLGDERVKLLHFGNGHTAGDLVVVFENVKVIHTGDLFFNGLPPYIDVADGSDTGNWIKTIESLCKKYPDYKFIPGHGKVAGTKEYLKMAEYLKYLRKEVDKAILVGKTKEQAVDSIDLDPYKDLKDQGEYCNKKGNIAWIYEEMTRKQ